MDSTFWVSAGFYISVLGVDVILVLSKGGEFS